MVSTNDRDRSIRTRHVPVNAKRGLSLHARRPQQRTLPEHRSIHKTDVIQRSTCSPFPPRPIVKSIFKPFFAVLNSTVIDAFGCSSYLQESLLEPAGSLKHRIYTSIQTFVLHPNVWKRKTVNIRSDICVRKSHTHYLFLRYGT